MIHTKPFIDVYVCIYVCVCLCVCMYVECITSSTKLLQHLKPGGMTTYIGVTDSGNKKESPSSNKQIRFGENSM